VKRISYEVPHYAVFFSLPQIPPSYVQIFSSALYSQTQQIYSSLSMRDQVLHPYKTAVEMMLLCVLIFFREKEKSQKILSLIVASIHRI